MSIVLYHHPFSRASGVVWMLEEVGVDYELRFVDLMKGAQKAAELVALNPMGKLPILVDGDAVVTESAAIGLYLADRYASAASRPSSTIRRVRTYLRWSLFAPSVIEPGVDGEGARGGTFKESQAGWGDVRCDARARWRARSPAATSCSAIASRWPTSSSAARCATCCRSR